LSIAAPLSWSETAARVDDHYCLKDRSLTALQFAGDDRGELFRKLQVADALERLDRVDPRVVIRWGTPRRLWATAGLCLAVALVMLVPGQQPVVANVPVETRRLVDEQAEYLEETMLKDLEELAKDNKDFEELVGELKKLVEELREPNVDEREALAKMSQMQQQLSAAMAAFNLEQVDAAFQSVAGSMEAAESLQEISKDLRAQEYDEAAEKLEKWDAGQLSNKEKRTVAGNLKKLSEELKKAKQGELGDATQEMSEGLEKNNQSKCEGAACKLAGLCRSQSLRKSVCQCMGNQLSRLSMCKGNCQGNKSGKNPNVAKSDSPKNSWGTGASNKPFGDVATNIDSQREQVDVTGQQGDGPSERELLTTPEAQQLATRTYQERYREFRKQAEAVLESEPLPLGHRQTVRQYFESIRPTQSDLDSN
jgi:hypothetical protein